MYDYFGESAQKVIHLGKEEATRLSHDHLTPEHILLGLVKEEGVVYKILEALKIDMVDIFSEIESLIGRGEKASREITLSPRSKKVLELAYNVAKELGAPLVEAEHILLGLIREGNSIAAQALHKRKVDFDKVVNELMHQLQEGETKGLMGPESFDNGPSEEFGGFGGEEMGPAGGGGFFGMPFTQTKAPPKKQALNTYGRDLTEDARQGNLDPVVNREKEIARVIRILSRRTKNNPVLMGDPGVGKTAIVEGLANRIIAGEVPDILKDKKIISLDLGGMVAGTKYRGEFEARVKKLIDEILAKKRQIILFIDELHTLVGAGGAEGAIDAANMLKPPLARGELQVIGATTVDEYRKNIEKDPALERRFQPVMVNEPTPEFAVDILKGIRGKYEEFHHISIPDDAIEAAVSLSDRYISDRFLPDKAIDVMDEAAAKVRLKKVDTSTELRAAKKELEEVKKEKEEALSTQKYEKAASLRDRINEVDRKIKDLEKKWRSHHQETVSITEEDVAEVVSDWTGIPVIKLTKAESEKLTNMEEKLKERVIGQEEALVAISQAIRRGRAGLKPPQRPIGSFIFAGPTGVGKTEVARRLAEFMFGTIEAMIRIDMSEFMEKHSVSRLIGAPPGYVGYEEGGKLTEAVRRKPYSVILFDEIEKAHPDVFNVLLQVLEDGRVTDTKGRTVDFKNCVIIMTSNIGQKMIVQQGPIGFMSSENREHTYEKMKQTVLDEMKRGFRPEFLNRIDEIIVFHELTDEDLKKIVTIMVLDVQKNIENQEMQLEINDAVEAKIAVEGHDPKFGARPLRRAVQRLIENPLSNDIIAGKFAAGDKVGATVVSDKIVFKKIGKANIKKKEKEKTKTKEDDKYVRGEKDSSESGDMRKTPRKPGKRR
ncbi:MAG: ATP-dependent Clp protease ATP-binding subunit [Candidatus Saganbacteria bacterium]|nr:ATP-dependent Clp protease ATP-binding subunit [Candidatus Saganbacteria bacterium]